VLVGRKRHLVLALGGPHPWPADLDATPAERDLAILMTVTDRGPVAVPPALRADDLVDLLLHHRAQHTEPDPDRQGEQPLLRCPDQLAQRLLHAFREHGLLHGRLRDRYVATHGGSSFDLGRSPVTLPRGADEPGGTAVTSNFYTRRDNLPWCSNAR
jgi:hypothetical protein